MQSDTVSTVWARECVAEEEGQFKTLALRRSRILGWVEIHIRKLRSHTAQCLGAERESVSQMPNHIQGGAKVGLQL